jgi:hypothetical protein
MKDYGIKYLDLEFTVRGTYEEEEPHMYEFSGNTESFDIYEILLDDKDITDIVDDYVIKELQERVINEYYR